jgi:hypothetical protein
MVYYTYPNNNGPYQPTLLTPKPVQKHTNPIFSSVLPNSGPTSTNSTVLPNSGPTTTTTTPRPTLTQADIEKLNAMWSTPTPNWNPLAESNLLPTPTTGPDFLSATGSIGATIPTSNLMSNYHIPDSAWTGDMVVKPDTIFDSLNNIFNPDKNGVSDAFDPKKNGVSDFVNSITNPPPPPEEKKDSNLLLYVGAGALILVFVLMK